MNYQSSENKVTDLRLWFSHAKIRFSPDVAHLYHRKLLPDRYNKYCHNDFLSLQKLAHAIYSDF